MNDNRDSRAPSLRPESFSLKATWGLLILTMAAWGGTFVAGRLVSFNNGPLTVAFWRFILAALVLLPLLIKREGRLLPPALGGRGWLLLLLLGLTGTSGYNYFFIKGLSMIEAGRASVIVAMNPSLTYLGTVLFFGQKFTFKGAAGFVCALGGAALVISRGRPGEIFSGGLGLGELLIFGCVLCWSAYTLLGKLALERLSPLMATTWASIIAVAVLAPAAFVESGPLAFLAFSPADWFCLAFLGILGTSLGFTLYYMGIVRLGAGRAAVFINLVPVFGLLCGWLFLDEDLGWYLVAGLVLVLSGIRLTQTAAED